MPHKYLTLGQFDETFEYSLLQWLSNSTLSVRDI